MPWGKDNDAVCDNQCGSRYLGDPDKTVMPQRIRAAGWHHAVGNTIGGQPYEAILCPGCARNEKKRPVRQALKDQIALPLEWEEWRRDESGSSQGFSSR